MSDNIIYPETLIFFFNLGEKEAEVSQKLVDKLRENGIGAELYHKKAMMNEQFIYSSRRDIPYAAIIGQRELESGTCYIKYMRTGEMDKVDMDDVVEYMSHALAWWNSRKK